MPSAHYDEQVERFQNMVGSTERVGVSEFARSRSWRDRLSDVGCFEVVDRSGVVGYMLAPEYASALSARIAELEEQGERAEIAAMFMARGDRAENKTGGDLKSAALAYFDDNADALMGIVNGD